MQKNNIHSPEHINCIGKENENNKRTSNKKRKERRNHTDKYARFLGLGVNAAFSVHSHYNTFNCWLFGALSLVVYVCVCVRADECALIRLMLLFSIVFKFVSIFMFQLQFKIHTRTDAMHLLRALARALQIAV